LTASRGPRLGRLGTWSGRGGGQPARQWPAQQAARAAAGPEPAARPPNPPDGLTQREAEILSLIAQGLTNGEIAERLFLSNHTVKTHINRIFAKTASRDRVAAIAYAQRHGIG